MPSLSMETKQNSEVFKSNESKDVGRREAHHELAFSNWRWSWMQLEDSIEELVSQGYARLERAAPRGHRKRGVELLFDGRSL